MTDSRQKKRIKVHAVRLPGLGQMLQDVIAAREAGDFDRHAAAVATLTLNRELAIQAADASFDSRKGNANSQKARSWSEADKREAAQQFIRHLNSVTRFSNWRFRRPSGLGEFLMKATGLENQTQAKSRVVDGCRLLLTDPEASADARAVLSMFGKDE